MTLQGIFNILDLYLIEIELFYNDVDQYFQKHISNSLKTRVLTVDNIEIVLKDVVSFLIDRFEEFG
ncbi:MAG TPA: hypothetical protein ENH98_04605, partial [archaeon]|nr:hypothetical protein [archaeon]